jgi:hypothetical protein
MSEDRKRELQEAATLELDGAKALGVALRGLREMREAEKQRRIGERNKALEKRRREIAASRGWFD